jgi:hypothetical protein
LEELAVALGELLQGALQVAGRPVRPDGKSVKWWFKECKEASLDY